MNDIDRVIRMVRDYKDRNMIGEEGANDVPDLLSELRSLRLQMIEVRATISDADRRGMIHTVCTKDRRVLRCLQAIADGKMIAVLPEEKP